MLTPSLYALYKQGRFRRAGAEGTDEGMRQVGRFAVAMLAFALQHDLEFRKDFLTQVCGRNRGDGVGEFLLELEVTGCGDLILRKGDNSQAFAFEFKVDAPIQLRNQHPRNPEFFTTGYRAEIRRRWGAKSIYILVQNDSEDFKSAKAIPICRSKAWRDISKLSYDRHLIRDLFESFGSLGIPAFIHMNTKNISLGHGDSTLDAVKLYKLLQAVAGVIGSKSKFDVDLDQDRKRGYIGMDFVPTAKSDEWQKLVQPDNDVIGWFGYSQDTNTDKSTLDVWFYCGKQRAAAAAKIRSRLSKNFPQMKLPSDVKNQPAEKNYVWISLPAEESVDNQEWFISVFDSLVRHK